MTDLMPAVFLGPWFAHEMPLETNRYTDVWRDFVCVHSAPRAPFW